MTATAVLLQVDRGKVGLDDDVRRYIPELPDYKRGSVTIRSLLNHTSGLPDYNDLEEIPIKNGTYITNTNYFPLASLIERIAQKPFSAFLCDENFKPLGMDRTFVNQTLTSSQG